MHLLLPALLLYATNVLAGSPPWTLQQSPTTEVLNGISIAGHDFAIGVGNGGTIVHFVDGDSGTPMPSGSTSNLLDVYALAPDFAVAAGFDQVLFWDGVAWQPIATLEGLPISPVWATPERDLIVYGTLGQQFNIVCPHVPGATEQPFCRTFGSDAMLDFCGGSGNIAMVTTSGKIYRVDNGLAEIGGGFGPVHDPDPPLSLGAAWIDPAACGAGPAPPGSIFAVAGDSVLHFDGQAWVDTGLVPDPGQTLNWLGGTGGNLVLAVGSQPAAGGGNDGVAWLYDGSIWTDLSAQLPAGTPGLTDVDMFLSYTDRVFGSGFEATPGAKGIFGPFDDRNGVDFDMLVTGELGRILSGPLLPPALYDLRFDKQLLSREAHKDGELVRFTLDLSNRGPDTAADVRIRDTSSGALTLVGHDCDPEGTVDYASSTDIFLAFGELPAGSMVRCVLTFVAGSGSSVNFGSGTGSGTEPSTALRNVREVTVTVP